MDLIKIRFMLNVCYKKSSKTRILPLPKNDNIFELFPNKEPEPILIVNSKGKAKEAMAFITVVNNHGFELV